MIIFHRLLLSHIEDTALCTNVGRNKTPSCRQFHARSAERSSHDVTFHPQEGCSKCMYKHFCRFLEPRGELRAIMSISEPEPRGTGSDVCGNRHALVTLFLCRIPEASRGPGQQSGLATRCSAILPTASFDSLKGVNLRQGPCFKHEPTSPVTLSCNTAHPSSAVYRNRQGELSSCWSLS